MASVQTGAESPTKWYAEACGLLNMPNLLDDDQVDRLIEQAAMPPVIYDGPVYVCSD